MIWSSHLLVLKHCRVAKQKQKYLWSFFLWNQDKFLKILLLENSVLVLISISSVSLQIRPAKEERKANVCLDPKGSS